ncbi:MAG: DUF4340 domain-containing protein [Xanthomonadales bacterium]|jgi:hypothetical protein|nr:DUF4340 domain-containing protein [Xanthomonadales bacterium]
MSKKHFSWLLGLTIVAALVAILLPGETGQESAFEKVALLPKLENQVNDIDWLQISAGGDTVATVSRKGSQWEVEEAAGYRADWPRVQQLLSALVSAEVIEPKTSNPDYYERLGVQDSSARIGFRESTGLPAVISGNTAQGREGQYVRIAGSPQSILIDRELDIPVTLTDWLDREIVDISDSEVVELSISHPDGETVVAKKVSADDENFELQGIPEGSEAKSHWTVNSLAGGFSSLQLDAVAPAGDIDWTGALRYRLVTADGLDLQAELVALVSADGDDQHWLRLEAGIYTTRLDSGVAGDGSETRERAEEIKRRTGGWAFRIARYKYDSLAKRMEDLVQKAETSG